MFEYFVRYSIVIYLLRSKKATVAQMSSVASLSLAKPNKPQSIKKFCVDE